MLDGHENTLEISDDQRPLRSPAKQKTLDHFVRRCDNSTSGLEHESTPKRPWF